MSKRSRMHKPKPEWVAFLVVLLWAPVLGMELRKPPDAGISNEQLEKLGRRADDELARRFSDPGNADVRAGLLIRMGAFGNLKRPSPAILNSVKTFVEREVGDCKGHAGLDRTSTIGAALQIIGQRGGAAGLKYLEGWIYDPNVYGRIQCSALKPDDKETTQSELRRDALWGIGRNGTKASLDLLLRIAKDQPPDKYPGSFVGVLNEAITENKLILKEGVDKHFKSDREFFTRRLE
jgi:hypothetical protein